MSGTDSVFSPSIADERSFTRTDVVGAVEVGVAVGAVVKSAKGGIVVVTSIVGATVGLYVGR
jgi:hypothetical protein